MELDYNSATANNSLSRRSVSRLDIKLSKLDSEHKLPETRQEPQIDAVGFSEAALKKLSISNSQAPKISLEVDGESHQVTANILDPESGEVIRQIPDKKVQELSQRINEFQRNYLKSL